MKTSKAEQELACENETHPRPRRSECIGGPRPCPLVGCRYNNFLRVTPQGHIKLGKWKEPEDVPPNMSCSLDLSDDGPQTLETIGEVIGLTRERVRQIEVAALIKIGATVEWTAMAMEKLPTP